MITKLIPNDAENAENAENNKDNLTETDKILESYINPNSNSNSNISSNEKKFPFDENISEIAKDILKSNTSNNLKTPLKKESIKRKPYNKNNKNENDNNSKK
jgi:hypothetical protein